ncbi:hypothetical protein Dimus_038528 [Dionaea muscipula]
MFLPAMIYNLLLSPLPLWFSAASIYISISTFPLLSVSYIFRPWAVSALFTHGLSVYLLSIRLTHIFLWCLGGFLHPRPVDRTLQHSPIPQQTVEEREAPDEIDFCEFGCHLLDKI